jgi:hypothetical protein
MKPKTPTTERAAQQDWAVLRQSQPSDYDGHTHFDRMLPAERLAWLESAVQFVAEVNSKFYPNLLDSKKTDHNAPQG